MNDRLRIQGAGGGGGKGEGGSTRTPVEAPDSLRSVQIARIFDIATNGPSKGPWNGAESFFLDGTPILNPDGSANFQGVKLAWVLGTQDQLAIPGNSSVESENGVGVELTAETPLVRRISNTDNDAARITISIPNLSSRSTDTGDLNGTSVSIAIDLQSNGGGFVEQFQDTITGKTTTKYQRSYRIALAGDPPWDIRLRRLTADSTSELLQNKTIWDSYTEIVDAKLRYPMTGGWGLEISAEQFGSIPARSADWGGAIVPVPSNYDPEARAYTGMWDGTFVPAWTDNPAWIYRFIVINDLAGLGKYISAEQVDKWALYDIAQRCDELVPDGYGGFEPRYTCNMLLQTKEDAYKVLTTIAGMFDSMTFWGAGTITAVQDKPGDPVKLFTAANVIAGEFSYTGTDRKARHTVALVTWNDPADHCRPKVEYVADEEGIARYGIVQTEVVAFGCTSRGQAHRAGRRILYTDQYETAVVSFETALESVHCWPGEIIQIADPFQSGTRLGGRIKAATTFSVTLDAPATLVPGFIYVLAVTMPDGTLEKRQVSNPSGEHTEIEVSAAFSVAPNENSIWMLASDDVQPTTWRVLSIAEGDGITAKITAVQYYAEKYALIEQDVAFDLPSVSNIKTRPGPVTDLVVTESLYLVAPGIVGTRVTVSWSGTFSRYRLTYRASNGNPLQLPDTSIPSVTIDNVQPGNYEFSVAQVSVIGAVSPPVTVKQEIYGKLLPPAEVSDFSIIKSSGFALAQWSLSQDLDVTTGGRIVIRHSPMVTGATWNDGIVLDEFDGGAVSGILPLITGTYMAKARDSTNNYSASPVYFVATEGMVTGFTTVATTTQHPTFPGAKTNTAVVAGMLQLDSMVSVDDVLDYVDTWPTIDALGGLAAAGSYLFDIYQDFGSIATRRLEADIAMFAFDTADYWDSRDADIDSWNDVDGAVVNDVDATLYYATTNDDPSGSPTWSPWTPFFVADVTCRAVKYKLDLVSGSPTHNLSISTLRVHAKVPA